MRRPRLPPTPRVPRLKKPTTVTMIQRSRAVSPAFKAEIHEELGAGKSQVRRRFFGLSPADEDAIADLVEADIDRRLKGL